MITKGIIGLLIVTLCTFHIVHEGNIGIYKRGGALLDGYSEPGIHFNLPFIT